MKGIYVTPKPKFEIGDYVITKDGLAYGRVIDIYHRDINWYLIDWGRFGSRYDAYWHNVINLIKIEDEEELAIIVLARL